MIFAPNIFKDKVVVITGGGTGIGKATTQKFASLGANCVIAARRKEPLEETKKEIESLFPGIECIAIANTDIRQEECVENLFQKVLDKFNRIDILINNAGANFLSPTDEMSIKGWNAVVGTVLTGTFLCSKAAARIMRDRGGGKIINMGATTAIFGSPYAAHSAAAKSALEGLTKTLASEWAKYKIIVNLIAIGILPTEGAKDNIGISDQIYEGIKRQTPTGRLITPEDIANVAAFLASPAGDCINGATIVVDGGHWFAKGFLM